MMKYLKLSLLVFLLMLSACNKRINEPSIKLNKDKQEIIKDKVSFNDTFSLSFWLKSISNYNNSEILKINDNNKSISLLSNRDNGLILSLDNEEIYADSKHHLKTNTYSHILISYQDNTLNLYLNNNLIINKTIKNKLDLKNLEITYGSDNFSGEYKEINVYDYYLNDQEINDLYNDNLLLRIAHIDYNDEFKNNAKGMVTLPKSDIKYEVITDEYTWLNDYKYLVFVPNETNEDINSKIKIIAEVDNKKVIKEIDFIIRADNEVNKFEYVKRVIDNKLQRVISESNTFEESIDAINITYEVIKGDAYFDDISKSFIKNTNEEKMNITVKASIESKDDKYSTEKELVLLDKYDAYLLTYFDGDDGWPSHNKGSEKIYFALSKDLKTWDKFADKSLINAYSGSNRYRDPFLNRDKDANFIITATEAWDNPGMYIIKSNDLINFDTKHVRFTNQDETLGLSGKRVWAPEFIYNAALDEYQIIYSDANANNTSIYVSYTKDFIYFTYPQIYFDGGVNIIDANVTMIDNQYYLFYKDEANNDIYYATCDNISNPTWHIHNDIKMNLDIVSEGPFVLNDYQNNCSYLYLDNFKESQIVSSIIYKNKETIEAYPSLDSGLTNLGGVRHFSIIELTNKEYERLKAYYGK